MVFTFVNLFREWFSVSNKNVKPIRIKNVPLKQMCFFGFSPWYRIKQHHVHRLYIISQSLYSNTVKEREREKKKPYEKKIKWMKIDVLLLATINDHAVFVWELLLAIRNIFVYFKEKKKCLLGLWFVNVFN